MRDSEHSRETLIIFSVALATFMARLDSYIVNVSLPTMAQYFDTGLFVPANNILIMKAASERGEGRSPAS